MNATIPRLLTGFLFAFPLVSPAGAATDAQEPPVSWIDPDTGHRVIRLTKEPGTASLYFNINAYTPDGKQMVYTTPDRGIGVIDLTTFETRPLVPGPVGGGPGAIVVGHKTPTVYYNKRTADPNQTELWSTNIDTGVTRKLADLPPRAGVFSINADETLGAGSYIIDDGTDLGERRTAQQSGPRPQPATAAEAGARKRQMMAERLAAHYPMILFTVDLATGERKTIFASTDWLDHLQFSPTDPTLLMYAHQGAWQQVDKLWTIRTDGSDNHLIDHRIMLMQGDGHQWWSADGSAIRFDMHFPLRGRVSFVASIDVRDGAQTWYHYEAHESSIHFNCTPDGSLFCGDGGTATGAQWIYLFRPELIEDDHTLGTNLIQPGILHSERLVNMSKHNYRLEPNVSFSPDRKHVIFRSNMFGPTYVFAVEVAKAAPAAIVDTIRP